MPVRLPKPVWRRFPGSAGARPEGSSTVGFSIGGAGAGTVGHARTSQLAKAAAASRRSRERMRAAWCTITGVITSSNLVSARRIGSASAISSGVSIGRL